MSIYNQMTRKEYAARKRSILDAAVRCARRQSAGTSFTRNAIAKEAGCSVGLVSRYLGDMVAIRRAVIKQTKIIIL